MERSRIGQDRDVGVRGDLGRQWNTELLDQVEHHLAARGSREVEPVQRAVHRVAQVVIDIDHEPAIQAGDTGPLEVAALHDDHRVTGIVDALGHFDLRHAGEHKHG